MIEIGAFIGFSVLVWVVINDGLRNHPSRFHKEKPYYSTKKIAEREVQALGADNVDEYHREKQWEQSLHAVKAQIVHEAEIIDAQVINITSRPLPSPAFPQLPGSSAYTQDGKFVDHLSPEYYAAYEARVRKELKDEQERLKSGTVQTSKMPRPSKVLP